MCNDDFFIILIQIMYKINLMEDKWCTLFVDVFFSILKCCIMYVFYKARLKQSRFYRRPSATRQSWGGRQLGCLLSPVLSCVVFCGRLVCRSFIWSPLSFEMFKTFRRPKFLSSVVVGQL